MTTEAVPAAALASVFWHSRRDEPIAPIAALIAVPGALRPELLDGTYIWDGRRWYRESDGSPLQAPAYWWANESDLLLSLEGARP